MTDYNLLNELYNCATMILQTGTLISVTYGAIQGVSYIEDIRNDIRKTKELQEQKIQEKRIQSQVEVIVKEKVNKERLPLLLN